MTDIMKLAQEYAVRYRVNRAVDEARAALQSAIEALQAENERLQSALAQCRDAFPIPVQGSPLEQDWAAAMGEPESVPNFVKASVDAMGKGKGEPVAWHSDDWKIIIKADQKVFWPDAKSPLYAAPKALAPTVLKPFTPCVCHDDTAKRYCKDKGKCSYFEAHGIGGTP